MERVACGSQEMHHISELDFAESRISIAVSGVLQVCPDGDHISCVRCGEDAWNWQGLQSHGRHPIQWKWAKVEQSPLVLA